MTSRSKPPSRRFLFFYVIAMMMLAADFALNWLAPPPPERPVTPLTIGFLLACVGFSIALVRSDQTPI